MCTSFPSLVFRRCWLLLVVLATSLLLNTQTATAQLPGYPWYTVVEGKVQLHLYVFVSETCPHCVQAEQFLDKLQPKYKWLHIKRYEVSRHPANLELYRQMAWHIGKQAGQVPAFFHCKQLQIGFNGPDTTGKQLEDSLVKYQAALQRQHDKKIILDLLVLLNSQETPVDEPDLLDQLEQENELPAPEPTVEIPMLGSMKAGELSLPTLTLLLAGLDAFNPCAFFVLMILLSLMLHTGSRWRMAVVGTVFVFFSGLMYYLFMAAWLNLFFLIGHLKLITLIAGSIAVIVALINIKDYFWFKAGVSLSLSESAKTGLFQRMNGLIRQGSLVPLLFGTAVLAFAANLYELLCTTGFPLVYTRVLTLNELSTSSYYGYLLAYNLVYVTPLAVIVLLFSLTLGAHKLTEYEGRVLKLISGMMMLVMGGVLIFQPTLLSSVGGALATLGAAVGLSAAIVLGSRWLGRSPAGPPTTPSTGSPAH